MLYQREITVNGYSIPIGENLYCALLALRRPRQPRMLWVDAICIDQSNLAEKNHQVDLMKKIYKQADSVIAWLGRRAKASSKVINLIKEINKEKDLYQCRMLVLRELRDKSYKVTRAYTSLLRRSYWYRTWIVQEIFSARQILVQCGPDIVSWNALRDFQAFLKDECYGTKLLRGMDGSHLWERERALSREDLEWLLSEVTRFDIISWLRESRWRTVEDRQRRTLEALLLMNWDATASDPRDKVFAIFKLASDRRDYTINIDYTLSVNEVYTTGRRVSILRSRSLNTMLARRPQNPAHGLPSWCQDWSIPPSNSSNALEDAYPFKVSPFSKPYHAAGIGSKANVQFSSCGQFMTASGWRLDTIRDTSTTAEPPSFESEKPKSGFNFFERLNLFCFPPRRTSSTPREPTEIEIWYAVYRRALRRGFRIMNRGRARHAMGPRFANYCRKKHSEFFAVLHRATTVYADSWQVVKESDMHQEWRKNCDIPDWHSGLQRETMTSGLRRSLKSLGGVNLNEMYKCFFVTSSGFIGLGPIDMEDRDVICILRGCDLPVVLRWDRYCFRLLGACYVVGFMQGQFLEHQEKYGIREESFWIG